MITESLAPTARLRVLETTDLHMQMLPYDYFTDRPAKNASLIHVARLIRNLRGQGQPMSLLFDNGDFLQGNPLADFVATQDPAVSPHPMVKAMNDLRYDAVGLGNHEFNYGLGFLSQALSSLRCPAVCSNLKANALAGSFTPSTLLNRKLDCSDGTTREVKIGVIAFVPPQIVDWDRAALGGQVETSDVVRAAQRIVPDLRAQGADIVVALCHGGIDTQPRQEGMENAALPLAAVTGVDAILAGHTHNIFPNNSDIRDGPFDPRGGRLHGKPCVMAGFYGSHLGVIDFDLTWDGAWQITKTDPYLISTKDAARPPKAPDDLAAEETMIADISTLHAATLAHVRQPIVQTSRPITSHFARAAPNFSLALLAMAQLETVASSIAGTPHEQLPLLSAVARFVAGGHAGPDHFINIPPGALTLRDVAAIYPFMNQICAVRRSGAQLRDWLDFVAGQFNPLMQGETHQQLLNIDRAPYECDVIHGLHYRFDLFHAKPRVATLKYQGADVKPDDMFLVATNSYRANGGSGILQLTDEDLLICTNVATRDGLIRYLQSPDALRRAQLADWGFVGANQPTQAQFSCARQGRPTAAQSAIKPTGQVIDGFAQFSLHL